MDAVTAGILLALVALIGSLTVWGFSTGYSAGFNAASLEAAQATTKSFVDRETEFLGAKATIAGKSADLARLGGDDIDRLLSGANPGAPSAPTPPSDTETGPARYARAEGTVSAAMVAMGPLLGPDVPERPEGEGGV